LRPVSVSARRPAPAGRAARVLRLDLLERRVLHRHHGMQQVRERQLLGKHAGSDERVNSRRRVPAVMPGEIERCARRVYEFHRAGDLKRRRSRDGRIPTWDELPEPERCRLIAAYWRSRSSYDVGRREPREVAITIEPRELASAADFPQP
jgi:hypothetical protein